ncbi:MAG: YaeQ family protein [Deltaproteobacteria bacterium]|nr:YaeQ family protein [Deltaproteobacteria bacterium]
MTLGLPLNLVLEVRLSHPKRGFPEVRQRLFLSKKRGESLDHVLMKLLAWLLLYDPALRIELSAEQHYKPDLVRLDERGEPLQWIDCGSTSLRKLDRIASRNRSTTIDIVKPTERELRLFKAAADHKVAHPERVRYFAFRDGFLAELGELVHSRHDLEATIGGDPETIGLTVDGTRLESPVVRL